MGIAYSDESTTHFSKPVDKKADPEHESTTQRAELFAALWAVRMMDAFAQVLFNHDNPNKQKYGKRFEESWVYATDSQYVVKGVTEWLPVWKVSPLHSVFL